MQRTQEHDELYRSLKRFIDREINPHVDEWEEAQAFPAHELFRKLGQAGFLGVAKPVEYGGLGLDYSYALVFAEALGHIDCGAVPMAIGVHTDMATPALARHGTDAAKQDFLAPSISGEYVACLGVSEAGAGSDVASIRTSARAGRGRLRDQRQQDVDHQRRASRLDLPACQHGRRAAASKQVAPVRADEGARCHRGAHDPQDRHARLRYRRDPL
jgi:alkylation response protein AidB-like acyl-CoA dehydrogenase